MIIYNDEIEQVGRSGEDTPLQEEVPQEENNDPCSTPEEDLGELSNQLRNIAEEIHSGHASDAQIQVARCFTEHYSVCREARRGDAENFLKILVMGCYIYTVLTAVRRFGGDSSGVEDS